MSQQARGYCAAAISIPLACSVEIMPSALVKEKCVSALEFTSMMPSPSSVGGATTSGKILAELWARIFPLVVAPPTDDGLGIMLVNSNAETHFSFTNALGMISTEQARGIEIAAAQYPRACWLIGLHHHPVEYPRPAGALSERIGTALINGSSFIRRLRPLRGRLALMHGHRHIDWIGECA